MTAVVVAATENVIQRGAVYILHHEERLIVFKKAGIDDFHDVLVCYRRDRLDLGDETVLTRRVADLNSAAFDFLRWGEDL